MNKSFKSGQLKALVIAHAKELMREPSVLFWGIVFPILMALGLGIAFTQKSVTTARIGLIENKNNMHDSSNSIISFLNKYGRKINKDNNPPEFSLEIKNIKLGNTVYIFRELNWKDADKLLKKGEINLVVEDSGGTVKYHFDPSGPDAQLNYLRLSQILGNNRLPKENSANIEPLTLKGTRYIDFLIPGLMALGILMSSIWGLGYTLIEKRSKKLLRRMIATPMKKTYFLASFMSVRTIMNFIESLLLFIFANLVFGITIQGNIAALFLIFIAGNINFAGMATIISCRTANPEVGNGIISAVTTPMFVLSGIFFSYQHFPDWSIPFIKIIPLTMLSDSIRSIFIEGAGFNDIALPFFVLLGMGILFFIIGLKLFKWY
ncbi:MAG: ABC transporter permease [Ignavibacteriaceae bacterium]